MSNLDSRLNAFRPDLADLRLKDSIAAERYAAGDLRQVAQPVVPVRRAPQGDSPQLTQGLMGERCRVFETREGWAWVQLETDGYVGYVAEDALSSEINEPTHRVSVPSTFIYPAAALKTQPVIPISMNACIAVSGRDGKFASLAAGGFIFAGHLKALGQKERDFTSVAELFLHVPYLWGGKSAIGLDCSGLVQVALQACGIPCPRDTDMQEKALGTNLPADDLDNLKRGDLVFWDGHVGIMTDAANLLHANGHFMQVTLEPLSSAVKRIKASYGEITSIKRL